MHNSSDMDPTTEEQVKKMHTHSWGFSTTEKNKVPSLTRNRIQLERMVSKKSSQPQKDSYSFVKYKTFFTKVNKVFAMKTYIRIVSGKKKKMKMD